MSTPVGITCHVAALIDRDRLLRIPSSTIIKTLDAATKKFSGYLSRERPQGIEVSFTYSNASHGGPRVITILSDDAVDEELRFINRIEVLDFFERTLNTSVSTTIYVQESQVPALSQLAGTADQEVQ